LLFGFLCLVLFFAVYNAIADRTTRVQSLSAIASSMSAVIALVVATWTDLKDRRYRQQALQEAERKRLDLRKRVAALFSAEITAWLDRKDVEDAVADLRDMEKKDSLTARIELLLTAKQAALSDAKEPDANFWDAEIASVSTALRLFTFKRLSAIPSIWTTQFRRDDIEVLDGAAPAYFVVMATIWTNLNLKAQQLSVSADALRLVRKQEANLMPLVINAIADDAVELREHIGEFLCVAKEGSEVLANYPENQSAEGLKIPSELLTKSRDRSQRLSEAWRLISIMRLAPLREIQKEGEKLVGEATASAKMAIEINENAAREAGKLEAAGRQTDATENKS
jgi:hypothetical protein